MSSRASRPFSEFKNSVRPPGKVGCQLHSTLPFDRLFVAMLLFKLLKNLPLLSKLKNNVNVRTQTQQLSAYSKVWHSSPCLFKQLAKTIAAFSGRTARTELLEHRQAMGILLRQANARAIFRRHPGSTAEGSDPLLAAQLALET